MNDEQWERRAGMIFLAAIGERRCGELLTALLNEGTATVDTDGRLVIINGDMLMGLGDPS